MPGRGKFGFARRTVGTAGSIRLRNEILGGQWEPARRRRVGELIDGIDDQASHGGAVIILLRRKLIRRARRFP